MNGRDFLPVARILATQATEAAWRSALSRAYYAAFHVARELMETLGFAVPKADAAHKHMAWRLSNCGDAQVEDMGRKLDILRGDRNSADYDLRHAVPQALAQQRITVAEQIIQTLDALAGPTLTRITDAMKIYERDVLQNVTWRP
jgi:uncharacterized protein (UPF0332 family)